MILWDIFLFYTGSKEFYGKSEGFFIYLPLIYQDISDYHLWCITIFSFMLFQFISFLSALLLEDANSSHISAKSKYSVPCIILYGSNWGQSVSYHSYVCIKRNSQENLYMHFQFSDFYLIRMREEDHGSFSLPFN